MIMTDTQNKAKQAAGQEAAKWIENEMVVGIGTGTTAFYFIEALIKRCQEGLRIRAIPTSAQTLKLISGHIPLADIDAISQLDITVDGADEIDWEKRMIKGGGGALLHEKIVASLSREMVVIIDPSKRVERLGKFPLPVEIVPFAYACTLGVLDRMGYTAILRQNKDGQVFLTDSGHYIADIHFSSPPEDLAEENRQIRSIAGIVDTGFFPDLAGRVITGFPDGSVEIQQ